MTSATKELQVWWVHQFASLASGPGSARHIRLAEALEPHNCRTSIISSTRNHFTGETEGRATFKHSARIPTNWNGRSLAQRYMGMRSFGLKVRLPEQTESLPAPDVIIGSSPSLHAAYGAQQLAKRKGVPFVFEIRDLWPESVTQIMGISSRNPITYPLRRMERLLVRDADAIISVMPFANDYYKDIPKAKFTWVPNGVDVASYSKCDAKQREEVHTVMYAGTHGFANGVLTMLDAAKLLETRAPQLRFRFVGDGVMKPEAMRHAQKNRLTNVVFEPPVPRAEIPRLLSEADVLLAHLDDLPLFHYGISPNKLHEYMAASRPVVFATTAKADSLTLAGAGPVVKPGDPQAMAARIEQIAGMSAKERGDIAEKGLAYVRANNAFDVLASRVANVLRQAAQRC